MELYLRRNDNEKILHDEIINHIRIDFSAKAAEYISDDLHDGRDGHGGEPPRAVANKLEDVDK